MRKNIPNFILLLSTFLMLDPFIRILTFKASTGLEWSLVWNNVVDNSLESVPMFIKFWVLSPIAGILLLTLSRTAYFLYGSLTIYNIVTFFTYKSFEWPYFAKTPHWSALILLLFNILFLSYMLWPSVKRHILSRHFRHIWDARGRQPSLLQSTAYVHDKGLEVNGVIENLSSGGVLFTVSNSINYGSNLELDDSGIIILKDLENSFLPFHFKIVNIRVSENKTLYGFEFSNMGPKNRMEVYRLLTDLEQNSALNDQLTPQNA